MHDQTCGVGPDLLDREPVALIVMDRASIVDRTLCAWCGSAEAKRGPPNASQPNSMVLIHLRLYAEREQVIDTNRDPACVSGARSFEATLRESERVSGGALGHDADPPA